MRGWMGKGMLCLCGILFALLLLSTLVEGPVPVAETAEDNSAPVMGTAFLPYALPMPGQSSKPLSEAEESRAEAIAAPRAAGWTAPTPGCRDANGCVVRTRRYVESAYQIFRQETASG